MKGFVVLAVGDEGHADDPPCRLVSRVLSAAGFMVRVVPCVGGSLDTRDTRLAAAVREVAVEANEAPLVLGGFSRGARIAAGLASELGAVGVLAFAYPFHGRTDPNAQQRVEALHELEVPMVLCQGTRDSLGNRQQVLGYRLPLNIQVHWLEDANHRLQPRARSGFTQSAQLTVATERAVEVMRTW